MRIPPVMPIIPLTKNHNKQPPQSRTQVPGDRK
jgi:hypothetical protein